MHSSSTMNLFSIFAFYLLSFHERKNIQKLCSSFSPFVVLSVGQVFRGKHFTTKCNCTSFYDANETHNQRLNSSESNAISFETTGFNTLDILFVMLWWKTWIFPRMKTTTMKCSSWEYRQMTKPYASYSTFSEGKSHKMTIFDATKQKNILDISVLDGWTIPS